MKALTVAVVVLLVGMVFVAVVGVRAVLADDPGSGQFQSGSSEGASGGGGAGSSLVDTPEKTDGVADGTVDDAHGLTHEGTVADTTTVTPDRPGGAYTGSTRTSTTAPASEKTAPSGTLARVATLSLDEARLEALEASPDPAAALRDLVQVTWEYKHHGKALPSTSMQVRYEDSQGTPVTRTLDGFTRLETIQAGDTVQVTGADFLSEAVVSAGGTDLASRTTVMHPWLHADDVALPVRAEGTSLATWETDASVGLTLDFTGLDASAVDGPTVDAFAVAYEIGYEGDMRLTSSPEGSGIRLAMEADIEPTAIFEGSASGVVTDRDTQASEPFTAAAEARFEGLFSGVATAVFSGRGALQEYGAGGSAYMDGTADAAMTLAGETESFSDSDMPHPLLDEQEPLSMQAWDASPPHTRLAATMQDLWDVDLAPGDRYEATFRVADATLRGTIQVEDGGARAVDGRAVPTLRVTSTLGVEGEGLPNLGFDRISATHWVHADRYIPVFAEMQHSKTLRAEDLQEILDGSGLGVTAPADIKLTVYADTTMALTGLEGELGMPAVLGLRSPSDGFLYNGVAAAALRFAAMGAPPA